MFASSFLTWFHPTIDALSPSSLPFGYRWRLLVFQPLAILIYILHTFPLWKSRIPYKVIYIPVRDGRWVRSLVYLPEVSTENTALQIRKRFTSSQRLSPLHLDIHGGGFIGGLPESNYRFCQRVRERTGAVVVSTTYRFAPRYPFPNAIDDVDDVVRWLLQNAKERFGADPDHFTISGSSAGGNLALATSLKNDAQDNRVKGIVTFYAPIDVSKPPGLKPKPSGVLKRDPASFLFQLFDSYGASERPHNLNDPRLSPYVAEVRSLPPRILMVVPTIDILLAEQLAFVERINDNSHYQDNNGKVELMLMKDCFHGWLELPSLFINEQTRTDVFDRCTKFLNDTYGQNEDLLKF